MGAAVVKKLRSYSEPSTNYVILKDFFVKSSFIMVAEQP